MDRSDASSLQGFITSYAFLSDFFGVSFNSEVVWVSTKLLTVHVISVSSKAPLCITFVCTSHQ